jgi:hypothetical protein
MVGAVGSAIPVAIVVPVHSMCRAADDNAADDSSHNMPASRQIQGRSFWLLSPPHIKVQNYCHEAGHVMDALTSTVL